jgi:carbohydrate diacid regulator
LCISYQDAKQKLKVGEKVYKNNDKYTRDIYHLNCLGFDFLLPSIDKETSDYYLRRLFNCDIVNLFNKNNIGEMIESLVENNINISRTANNLFIHRNTLLYRLKKIEEVTGLNPRNLKELYSLLMAYHIYKYNY